MVSLLFVGVVGMSMALVGLDLNVTPPAASEAEKGEEGEVIDPEGTVQHSTVNNLPVGRNVDEVLRLLHAFQFTKESGNVCPANWVQGDAGMAASLDGVKGHIG